MDLVLIQSIALQVVQGKLSKKPSKSKGHGKQSGKGKSKAIEAGKKKAAAPTIAPSTVSNSNLPQPIVASTSNPYMALMAVKQQQPAKVMMLDNDIRSSL